MFNQVQDILNSVWSRVWREKESLDVDRMIMQLCDAMDVGLVRSMIVNRMPRIRVLVRL